MINIASNRIVLSIIVCTAFFSARIAHAESRFFTPVLSVSEEFTDNVEDTKLDKRSEYITRFQPGFFSKYEAKRMTWDISYAFDYRYYTRNQKDNDHSHIANAKGTLQIIENFLIVDMSDTFKQVSNDSMRDQSISSLASNLTEQNIAVISPYLLWRPTPKTNLKTGYNYKETRYWDETSIEKKSHSALIELQHELTANLSLTAGYTFTSQTTDLLDDKKNDASIGARYNFREKSYLNASVGQTWQQFSNDYKSNYRFWIVSINHDFTPYSFLLETRRQTSEDPATESTRDDTYTAKLERRFDRGSISVSGGYTERYNITADKKDQNKSAVGIAGKYEITSGLTFDSGMTTEYFHYYDPVVSASNYPYRLITNAKLIWQFREQSGLSVAYTRVANQQHFDKSANGWTTNRVIAELKMTF